MVPTLADPSRHVRAMRGPAAAFSLSLSKHPAHPPAYSPSLPKPHIPLTYPLRPPLTPSSEVPPDPSHVLSGIERTGPPGGGRPAAGTRREGDGGVRC